MILFCPSCCYLLFDCGEVLQVDVVPAYCATERRVDDDAACVLRVMQLHDPAIIYTGMQRHALCPATPDAMHHSHMPLGCSARGMAATTI